MPNTEPNALPPPFDNWEDWRAVYTDRVSAFKSCRRSPDAVRMLAAALGRLGYVGTNLEAEIEFIKGNNR